MNLHESRVTNLSKSLIEESDYKPIHFGLDSGTEGESDASENGNTRSMKEKLSDFESNYMKPLFKKSNSQQFNYDIEITEMKPSDGKPSQE